MIQPLIKQACDMVHREQFTASITSLGLLETEAEAMNTSPGGASTSTASQSCHKKGSQIPPRKTKYVQVGIFRLGRYKLCPKGQCNHRGT